MSSPSNLLPVALASQAIMADAACSLPWENIPLQWAQGRVLAEHCHALVNVPPADNSAMDGYALRMADLPSKSIPVSQRVAAGQIPKPLQEGTCARVFTGTEVPEGTELVVMQEDVEQTEDGVHIIGPHKLGAFIRRKGQDVCQDSLVVSQGCVLSPRHLGVLASVGIVTVKVYRKLKVAMLATGSELVNPGTTLAGGQIYNSNRYQLAGLIQQLGMEFVDCGIVKDQADATHSALKEASQQADVVITSGGVSVGEEDYVKSSVEALGELKVWKLAIKPGKPLAFGYVQNTPFFGLPGNPVSVLVTFMVMVRPYLLTLQGVKDKPNFHLQARLSNPPKRPSVRQEYLRSRVVGTEHGLPLLEAMANQNSGVLSTAMRSDGLAIIPVNACGDDARQVEFLPFNVTIS